MVTTIRLILLSLASIGSLVVSAYIALVNGISFDLLSRDVFSTADIPVYYGLTSNVGVFFWIAAGVVAVFTSTALRLTEGSSSLSNFLGLGGLLSLLLAFDDFFMLHELGYGINLAEGYVYTLFALATILLFGLYQPLVFHDSATTHHLSLLILALALMASSFAVDVFKEQLQVYFGQWGLLIEDGLKFQAIIWWSTYFVVVSLAALTQRLGRSKHSTTMH